jgi:hypothetical protein
MAHPYIMQSARFATPAADQVMTPEERVFRNTTPGWLRVHAIGVGAIARGAGGASEQAVGVSSQSLDHYDDTTNPRPEWAIRFGSTEVTNGWVPVPATTWDPHGGEFSSALTVFDQPVYLAPGDRIDFKLRCRVAPSAGIQPYLFARCSPVDRPATIRVPVLYGWESSRITPAAAAIAEDVPVGKFYNEHNEPILVERMIGRLGLDEFMYQHRRMTTVLGDLELHDGTKITRVPTPLSTLFDMARQSWTMNFNLPSKGYIKTALSGSAVAAGDAFRVYLGMLGYRTIA